MKVPRARKAEESPRFFSPLKLAGSEFLLFYTPRGLLSLVSLGKFPTSPDPYGWGLTAPRPQSFRTTNLTLRSRWNLGVQNPQKKLEDYFAGKEVSFSDFPVDLSWATPFTRKVLEETRKIPWGKTVSYGELAKRVGNPRAFRAVGQALGRNLLPIIIPCHRVIGKKGDLVGFGLGLSWKKKLLELEKSHE